jgi:hypothetical protein
MTLWLFEHKDRLSFGTEAATGTDVTYIQRLVRERIISEREAVTGRDST